MQQGLAIDKERLMTFRDFLKQLISEVKVRFLKSKITDWQGKKYIFNMVCTFLLKKSWVKLSNHNPRDVLLSVRFSKFFTVSCKKNINIRMSLKMTEPPCSSDQHRQVWSLNSFFYFTVVDVASLLKFCVKSSLRDPIQAFLLIIEIFHVLSHKIWWRLSHRFVVRINLLG